MGKILETCKEIGIQLALCDTPVKSKAKSSSQQNMLMASLEEPEILPWYRPCYYVKTLSEIYEKLESEDPVDQAEKWMFYVELSFVFRGLGERRSLRRSLRSARQHAPSRQQELILGAWLKYERRGEELDELCPVSKSKLWNSIPRSPTKNDELSDLAPVNSDVVFLVQGEKVPCIRKSFGSLSFPFNAMLFGGFKESSSKSIDFTNGGLSVDSMKVVERFSRTGKLDAVPDVIIEIMSFCRVYLCDGLRTVCDRKLASMVHTLQDAVVFLDIALQQNADALLAACMGIFLAELPYSLKNAHVANLFCTEDGKRKLKATGYYSFTLYCLLSQACLEEDISSEMTMRMLLRAREFASTDRRKVLVNHQLGCSMLAGGSYKEAYGYFHAAVDAGHDYSLAGFTRVKYKRGFTLPAYTEASFTIETHKPRGWMYQERSLYRVGAQDKLSDLNAATELDPSLTYPYKYRAALLVEQKKMQEALAEISRVLAFRMAPDCLEFRVYVNLTIGDYRASVRDLRVILAIDPKYRMYKRRLEAGKLLKLLSGHVSQMSKADCWLKLYDCWSAIDDVGSLAMVHQMLESDGPKGTLLFRLSSLLLRMNCPKAALQNLKLARDSTNIPHERLVYEGWLLFDIGHREEALRKAEESIAIQRSFEAFFLKSFILQEMPSDPTSGRKAIGLLEEALKCPSDGLRKGQALNNMGNLYTDAENLDMAVECFTNAIKIRHARAHQGLAKVYAIRGDKRAAFNEMTKLIQKIKKNAEVYEKRALYGEVDMLAADLSMATQIDPMRSNPYKMRAAILAEDEDDIHHAIRELTKAIELKVDIQLVHVRAAFYESSMQLFDALRDCRAALAIDPKHPGTLAIYERIKNLLDF